MRKSAWLAGILAGSILLSACGRNEKDKAEEEQTRQQQEQEQPQQEAPDVSQDPQTPEKPEEETPQELAAVSTALHDWDEGRMEGRLATN